MNEKRIQYFELGIKLFSFLAVILTISIGSYEFLKIQEKDYKQKFLELQLETCVEITEAASDIALTSKERIPSDKVERIFSLYYSKGLLTLNQSTLNEVIRLGRTALRCNDGLEQGDVCLPQSFNLMAADVANSCRDFVVLSWELPVKSLDSDRMMFE